jgi:Intracellular proteinase inhibitor
MQAAGTRSTVPSEMDRSSPAMPRAVVRPTAPRVLRPRFALSTLARRSRRGQARCDDADAFDPVSGLGVWLQPDPRRPRAGRDVRWEFVVQNRGAEPRLLAFGSTQQGDVALGIAGVEHYRYSRDKLFAQVVVEQELEPGDEWGFALEDVLAVEPGRYSLLATVTATPALPPLRGKIRVA